MGTSVVGDEEGARDVGAIVDMNTGKLLGTFVGSVVVGFNDGSFVAVTVDVGVGIVEGVDEDLIVGEVVGFNVGLIVVGIILGELIGTKLGDKIVEEVDIELGIEDEIMMGELEIVYDGKFDGLEVGTIEGKLVMT